MAASRYEVEVTVSSARDLKNVNWRNGELKPYAVLWIDGGARCSTRVDLDNGDDPVWDQKLVLPLPPSSAPHDAVLYVDVVHANAPEGVKPLVGSARLPLRDVLDDAGVGGKATRTLRLKRPSGRPQGKLDVRVAVKEPARYYPPAPAGGAAYYQHQQSSRDPAAGAGGYGYGSYGGAAAAGGYGAAAAPAYAAAPPAGYPAAAPTAYGYGAPPPPVVVAAPAYVSSASAPAPAKSNKMGMGTGLAVGAAAGVLGGLALAGGASYLENRLEDRIAERVEDNLYDDDDYGDDDY